MAPPNRNSAALRGGEERPDVMTRNILYLIIGLLLAGVVVVGYLYYQEREENGFEVEIDNQGIDIEGN